MPITISLRAHEFPTLLDLAPPEVRILSLDCFDTLLWRNAQAPVDVFADLPIEGGAIAPRSKAETLARDARNFKTGRTEVSIEDIYRRLTRSADETVIADHVAREIDAEARHCFGFTPTIDLVHDAKARGWQVIVVSDTYLSSGQLRDLIARSAGADVADAIDRIFVSSEHAMSKTQGLFGPVLAALGVAPGAILHLGDNLNADQIAPAALGLSTAHFVQFDEPTAQRLRLEAAAATVIDGRVRIDRPAVQPHRPLLSMRDDDDAAWTLGHDVVGPLMHAFVTWVQEEIRELAARTGRPVKPLFLMRDGFLPMKMFEMLPDAGAVSEAAISRLTAGRASFVDADAIGEFVTAEAPKHRPDVLAGLLLLHKAEVAKLLGRNGTTSKLAKAVMARDVVQMIVRRSSRHAERLIAHVRRAGIERGDVVLLVDLGYNGTVQNHIDRLLTDSMGVSVAGRYLLFRETEPSGLDKKGFFDTRHYDRRMLETLCTSIAVIEQLSTAARGSVLDYEPNGSPIYDGAGIKGAQSETRERVQAAAITYGHKAVAWGKGAVSDDADARRRMAAAILARFLFLPMEQEVAVLAAFDHDVNLGTNDTVKLIDAELSAGELRRRGLPYVQSATRMYLPGELQGHGLELNLSMFSSGRMGLDLRASDFQVGAISVPVIVADATRQQLLNFDAFPTHDGYYALSVPIGAAQFMVGVQLGALFEVVQIEEARFLRVAVHVEGTPTSKAIEAITVNDGMQPVAQGVFSCEKSGVVMVPPPTGTGTDPLMLSLIFRPVVRRSGVALRMAA
jgi:FMN phosphatase YigB (HAD superfamily)